MPPIAATTPRRGAAPAPTGPADLPSFRRPTARRLVATARELGARPELWAPHRGFSLDERHAVRVAATPTWEAWILGWLPGQTTGLHDHGGSAGAFVVIEGALQEATLAPPRRHQPAALLHRTLDTGRHRSFGPHHVHQVVNLTDCPAVSLHVYAPRLQVMTRYTVVAGAHEVAGVARAGDDW